MNLIALRRRARGDHPVDALSKDVCRVGDLLRERAGQDGPGCKYLCAIDSRGRVRLVLGQFFKLGVDTLEPMESPPRGHTPLKEARDKVVGRIYVSVCPSFRPFIS